MATTPACGIARLGSFKRSDACGGDVRPRSTVPAKTPHRYCSVFFGIYLTVEDLAIRVSRSVRALTKRRSRARARQGRARADMIPPPFLGTGREHVQVLAPLASHRAIDRVQSNFGRCPASQRNRQWRASFAACQTRERAITKKMRRAYRALYLGIQTFELSVASADDVPVWKPRRHERMSSSWLRHTERGALRGQTNVRRADRTDRGESLHAAM